MQFSLHSALDMCAVWCNDSKWLFHWVQFLLKRQSNNVEWMSRKNQLESYIHALCTNDNWNFDAHEANKRVSWLKLTKFNRLMRKYIFLSTEFFFVGNSSKNKSRVKSLCRAKMLFVCVSEISRITHDGRVICLLAFFPPSRAKLPLRESQNNLKLKMAENNYHILCFEW